MAAAAAARPLLLDMDARSRDFGAMSTAQSTENPEMFDIAVVGGGLVGLPLALGFAQAGFKVAVIDAQAPEEVARAEFDGRVSALSPASLAMFGQLGVLPHLESQLQPVSDIMVTDGKVGGRAAPFFLHFDAADNDTGPLMSMAENRHIRIAAQKAAESAPDTLHQIAPDGAESFARDAGGVDVRLASGRVIRARLAVAADGRASRLRAFAGLKTVGWSYDQMGIVTTVEHELPHDGTAQEYFLPSGPFAILPMQGNRSSLVWSEKTALAKTIMAMDEDGFARECAKRFGDYLGAHRPVGPRWSYPLGLQLAHDYVSERIALVGDAAHVLHPLAGQGLNWGLKDAAALIEVAAETARVGLDIGSLAALERYQRWRRFDAVSLALVTDGLNRLFSNDVGPLRLLRDVGLGLVGKLGPARRFLMREAAGGSGDVPKLLKGEPV